MSFKKNKIYSILNNKCPRCHEGSFFETNNPYDLKKFGRMNSNCAVCNENFKRETGFYFGAAYVSYGLTVAFGIGLYLLLDVLFHMETLHFLIIFTILLIILLPIFYRLARIIWINMFVKYSAFKKS
ncbi:MAG: DUF983 domain-containing protein [Bacteroidia bacterium]